MIDFNSLLSHEQALAMLLAYFEGYSENKANILKLGPIAHFAGWNPP